MPVGGGTTRAGLDGEYFANPNLEGEPAFTRRDVRVSFDWLEGEAGKGLPVGGATTPGMHDFPHDDFSIRWTGAVVPRFSETYTFRITGKDGVRLKLGRKVVVDSLGQGAIKEVAFPMATVEKITIEKE
jgi:mannan endo-1,4-beta-mannosidase